MYLYVYICHAIILPSESTILTPLSHSGLYIYMYMYTYIHIYVNMYAYDQQFRIPT
jgi:hypothetical protein